MKKGIWLIAIVVIIILAIVYLEPKAPSTSAPTLVNTSSSASSSLSSAAKAMLYARTPELAGISGYLNTDSITIAEELAKGNIVLIDFWTYTCINCIRTLPYLTAWDEK